MWWRRFWFWTLDNSTISHSWIWSLSNSSLGGLGVCIQNGVSNVLGWDWYVLQKYSSVNVGLTLLAVLSSRRWLANFQKSLWQNCLVFFLLHWTFFVLLDFFFLPFTRVEFLSSTDTVFLTASSNIHDWRKNLPAAILHQMMVTCTEADYSLVTLEWLSLDQSGQTERLSGLIVILEVFWRKVNLVLVVIHNYLMEILDHGSKLDEYLIFWTVYYTLDIASYRTPSLSFVV